MSCNKINLNFVLFLLIISTLNLSEAVSVEEDVTLTHNEKLALDKFRIKMSGHLTENYMKEDIYLIKFLRAKNFDVRSATEMLLTALKWRKDNGIDGILSESFPFAESEYPLYTDAFDRTFRPVASADVKDWDARRAVISGKMEEVFRYALQKLELQAKLVRDAQAKKQNVTQFTFIINLSGFNIIEHTPFPAIPHYIRFVLDYEKYYPGVLHKLILINTPGAVDALARILLPLASPYTRKSILFYSTNKSEWQKDILKEISPNQLRKQFGGTLRNELEY